VKGLKIIPAFLVLIFFSYLGLMFVEANREEVVIHFANSQSVATPLGFVILTSVLIGMVFAGCLCSVEMLFLYIQNRRLKRKLLVHKGQTVSSGPAVGASDLMV
jgi:uncharacterized integral membrane protein